MSELLNEVESAFVSLIAGNLPAPIGPPQNVYPGKSSGDKALPWVVCAANGEGEDDPKGSGNFWVNVRIMVKTWSATEAGGPDPKIADVAFVSNVWTILQVTNLDTQLNAQARNLTVFPTAFLIGAPTREYDAEGSWMDILTIRLYCCNSILAP